MSPAVVITRASATLIVSETVKVPADLSMVKFGSAPVPPPAAIVWLPAPSTLTTPAPPTAVSVVVTPPPAKIVPVMFWTWVTVKVPFTSMLLVTARFVVLDLLTVTLFSEVEPMFTVWLTVPSNRIVPLLWVKVPPEIVKLSESSIVPEVEVKVPPVKVKSLPASSIFESPPVKVPAAWV